MIDLNLYPKHDWEITEHVDYASVFPVDEYKNKLPHYVILECKKCKYFIREIFTGESAYLVAALYKLYNGHIINSTLSDISIEELRKQLLSCDEVLIKNILE